MSPTKIVIVGGSYGGLLSCERLCKLKDVEVVLIAPNTQTYFNLSSPRVLLELENLPRLFHNIEEYVKKRCKGCVLVSGKVTDVDLKNDIVYYDSMRDGDEAPKSIDYDHLVLATGTRGSIDAFQLSLSHQDSIDSLTQLNSQIKQSQVISVIGGGPTGVEVAGEIKGFYPDKKVTMYCGKDRILSSFDASLSEKCTAKLEAFGVEVVPNKRFTYQKENRVYFEDGSSIEVDLNIDTSNYPNSEFLPDRYKDNKGFVLLDEYHRLKDNKNQNVWVLGDVVSGSNKNLSEMYHSQIPCVKDNIQRTMNHRPLAKYKRPGQRLVLPIHKATGVGVVFGYCPPAWLVYYMKGKDYMVPHAKRFLG